MFPRALQGAKRPAESLLREALQRVWSFGVRNGAISVRHGVPGAAYLEREILVLCQGVVAKASSFLYGGATPRANRAGDDRYAVEQREGAAVEILTRYVLEGLPPRDDIDPIADARVARNRADLRVDERLHELRDRVAREDRVGIETDHDVMSCARDSEVQRARLSAVRLRVHGHARVVVEASTCLRVGCV